MKNISLLLCLLSLPSFACPYLGGTYGNCTSTSPEYPIEAIEIGQFGSHYTMTATSSQGQASDEVFADGQVQRKVVRAQGLTLNVDVKGTCTGEKLVLETKVRELFLTETSEFQLRGTELRIDNYRRGQLRNRSICQLLE